MRVPRPALPPAALSAALLAATGAVAGCALTDPGPGSILDKIEKRGSLVIGVKEDQPGLGEKKNGRYQGFDVDVATYVAGQLGVPPERITFRTTPSSRREQALRDGEVDLVFATYSITQRRKNVVTFGGPYYVAHQDTLVRAGENGIDNVRDLGGRKMCAVEGSNSWRRVVEERKVQATRVNAANYGECLRKLTAGELDAISTDDLILAGMAGTGAPVKIVNAPFTDEKYGVGLRKGDLAGCEAVNRALTEMYRTGTAVKLLDKWFAKAKLKSNYNVPQFEGCS
ncbi:glutamate ABC transporter substrate-binding protein [Actinomadura kijaniata]|uniref:glutamate ABC transporter substrate-binding protein n=1 Tax=Actinomadura kijaniata TaxID=46161 RepID=UPI0008347746|nr:glutamate ABC transporter substrate-binding protein [Actinomadura kijaniata]